MAGLKGKTGIVTGGSSGIGFQIANVLAQAGATVYVISRTGKPKEGVGESAPGVVHLRGDIGNAEAMKTLVAEMAAKHNGCLDFLVNNAGVSYKCRAEDFPMEQFDNIMNVNVKYLFQMSVICYPYLKKSADKGRIINITSMSAHLGFSEVVPYCASKGAVLAMTRALAVEWAQDNITVNSIAPGWFRSKMNEQVVDAAREQKILNRMPLHAYGDTRDLGKMAEFLVGDGAAYITGQDFAVDGGALAFWLLRGASLQFFGSFARVPDKGTEFRWHNGGTIMAIFEKTIRNKNFDKLLRKLENEIPDSSWSADLEAGSDFKEGDARCSVRVFERYSMMGGNRLSLTLTMFQNGDSPIRLSAITAGGSQAVFFKVNTLGEESFLEDVKNLLEEILEE